MSVKTPMSPTYGVTPASLQSTGNDEQIMAIRDCLEVRCQVSALGSQAHRSGLQRKADEETYHQLVKTVADMKSAIEGLSYRCIYLERQQAKDREKSLKEIDDNNVQILKQVRCSRPSPPVHSPS